MARLSNQELDKMSVSDLRDYAHRHPPEASRISKHLAKASIETGKVAIYYAVDTVMPPRPASVNVSLT